MFDGNALPDGGAMLRHTLATVAYRAEKVLRDVPTGFADFRIAPGTRRAVEILAHMGDLYDWALWLSQGQHVWNDATPLPWEAEVARFFAALRRFDDYVATGVELQCSAERLFQGPVADSLTHVGQLAIMRRLAGAPVRGENYFKAEIDAGRVGRDQSADRVEFD